MHTTHTYNRHTRREQQQQQRREQQQQQQASQQTTFKACLESSEAPASLSSRGGSPVGGCRTRK